MAQYDATTTGQVLKTVFSKDMIRETIYPNNPFLAMLKKEQVGGDGYKFPLKYENSGGRSRTIGTALANKKPAKFVSFTVTLTKDYNATSFDRLFMAQTSKDEFAFLDAATTEVENLLKRLTRSLAQGIYRNTGGGKGVVGSATATTITLGDIEEVANFATGDTLVASSADGSTTTDTLRTGSFLISSINRDTGVLTGTFSGTLAATITAADTLFVDGDFQLGIAGLAAWCPATAPGSTDSFYGANRFPDITRLAGCRLDCTGDVVSEAIQKATARLGREGASPDTVLMSHAKMRDLILELGSKVEYEGALASDANVGFKGVKFHSPSGVVTCFADHNCPNKRLFVTKKAAHKIIYAGSDVPELQDDDGSVLFREATSDGYEARASYYANMVSMEPEQTCNVKLES